LLLSISLSGLSYLSAVTLSCSTRLRVFINKTMLRRNSQKRRPRASTN